MARNEINRNEINRDEIDMNEIDMNVTAYKNLKLLKSYSNVQFLISDNDILSLIEKDSYDTFSQIKSLEYPIYYTYHQILNDITYDNDMSYHFKKYLLETIIVTLDNLINYIEDYEEDSERLITIINDIYERTDKVKGNTTYKWLENIIYLFDKVKSFI